MTTLTRHHRAAARSPLLKNDALDDGVPLHDVQTAARHSQPSTTTVYALVDTGVFSVSISRRRRARFESRIALMAGHQVSLAAVTLAELREGALLAGWGDQRRRWLEQSIASTTAVPVSDSMLTTAAELRHVCRRIGHALHEPVHANDLWIAASALQIGAPLLTADAFFDDVPGLNIHP